MEQKQEAKFLRVYIHENLSWKSHSNFIGNKMDKSVGIIYPSRYLLPTNTKLSLYYTLIYRYLSYCMCNIVWSSTYITNLKRIYFLQKRVLLTFTNSEHHAQSAPLFAKFKILDIFNISTFYVAKFMFSYHQLLLPSPLLNLFEPPVKCRITPLDLQRIMDHTFAEVKLSSLLSWVQKIGILCQDLSLTLQPLLLSKNAYGDFCL